MRIEERQTEWAAQRTARGVETARWHKRGQPGEGRRGTSLPTVSFPLRSGRQRHLPGGELDGDETGWSWSWGTFSGTRRGDRSQTGQSLTEVAG